MANATGAAAGFWDRVTSDCESNFWHRAKTTVSSVFGTGQIMTEFSFWHREIMTVNIFGQTADGRPCKQK